MDKTVKIPVYNDGSRPEAQQEKIVKERDYEFELAKKDALLEEERSKSMELLKTIVQLRESLKQEQIKTSEIVRKASDIETQLKEAAARDIKDLAAKVSQLDEEKKRSHELMRTIEQLKDTLKQEQEQAKKSNAADLSAALEAKTREAAALEAKVRELANSLNKIAGIAAAGKLFGEA